MIKIKKIKDLIVFEKRKNPISSSKDLFSRIQKINIDYSQENFILFCFDSKNDVVGKEVIFKGGLNMCVIDPKVIFRKALLLNANAVIVAHNHPSNDLTPSPEDIEIAKKLRDVGNNLQLKVMENIIFNKDEFYSIDELD